MEKEREREEERWRKRERERTNKEERKFMTRDMEPAKKKKIRLSLFKWWSGFSDQIKATAFYLQVVLLTPVFQPGQVVGV